VDLLERFLQAYEDHPEGVRFLMAEMAQELGLHGTLADVLTVEERYRRAIEYRQRPPGHRSPQAA